MFLIIKLSCSIEYLNFKVIHPIVCCIVRNEMTVKQNKILQYQYSYVFQPYKMIMLVLKHS